MTTLLHLVLLLAVALPAAAQHEGHDHDDHAHQESAAPAAAGSDAIVLAAAVQQEFGITTAPAGPAEIVRAVTVPAEIRPDAERLAHITPRYDGLVTAVHVRLGDRVEAGQVLAEIESDATLASYELRTLVSGTVLEKHAVLGEAVGRGAPAFVVADLSRVWIDLAVHQHDLARMSLGQEVRMQHCHDRAGPVGVISYIAPTVDPHTRTGIARIVLPNPHDHFRPGTFLSAEVVTDRIAAAVAVPRDAVQTVHGHDAVFVRTDEGFVERAVAVGDGDAGHVAITRGLAAGEEVVVTGAFVLKSEREKAAFGSGHGHAH
jgi:cobalt-zinc-cadmium efflux system membrane fusion protein